MEFRFFIGTKAIFGRGCLAENAGELKSFGDKAFIVTGKTSGKKSGALDEVIGVLKALNISYCVYDGIENNPSLENVSDAGEKAFQFGADFVIGIGGGSPLDAAKAVAVLAVNPIPPVDLFKNTFEKKPLPIAAIPTTAGTGSEITPYSVLTRKDLGTKMSFGNANTFPKLALLDPRYTESLPYNVTVDTAVDALSHAVEGYLNRRSTPVTDVLALEAISIFGDCLSDLLGKNLTLKLRDKLLYMAMVAGMVISHTGTTVVHSMGYSLTYYKGLPHGRANGLLMAEYLKFNLAGAGDRVKKVYERLKISDADEFKGIIDRLMGTRVELTEEELNSFASQAAKQKNASYCLWNVTEEDVVKLYKSSLME